ncbi:hypothetical protein K505DRAFT_234338 [Melanomma pulvis-pyrius CBS 109.77]|uniref:Zn(2)-C6 fungal-type domain-containing protein n=1 Tax=Melanomma pulvis-pyrius CBS 109.77 TaxID=1314802 RepID=A0A6A6XNQ5_9PLEO|nr:hypothetical protein K505DRAFT_234338 [Melanomma pulvis-pyrius CBS 109.77]
MTKAKHNCWTCKERKVGCDRALPKCANCKRSNRPCQGYDLKLAWPDKVDGRRKQKKYRADPTALASNYITQDGSFAFLNTTSKDLSGRKFSVQEMMQGDMKLVPAVSSICSVNDQDGLLLSYYDSVLARMITTIDDDTNGFRLDLIQMALSSSDASSRSLLQATLALSSFHLGRQEKALQHKVQAIKSLSESFQAESTSKLAQLATCMMLCVYSVFDASDTTWHVHLQGAKTITAALTKQEREVPCFEFLSPWFNYHDTLSSYSHPAHLPSEEAHQAPDILLPECDSDSRKIIGSLGCSTELLQFVYCINQLRSLKDCSRCNSAHAGRGLLELSLLIRARLQHLKQEIHINIGETTGTIDHQRITLTAEFYRVATLLYLYQVAPPQAIPEKAVQGLVNDGFQLLDQMGLCTSPWPLFIIACNVTSDAERLKIFSILHAMNQKRRIGNYEIIKGLIQTLWKQQDLSADERAPKKIDWRSLIDPNSCIPSFI